MARILIVDDEENIRLAFRAVLEENGHEVSLAGNVAEADQLLAEKDCDVVLCDLIMPGCKGTELLKRIHRKAKGISVVMVTGEPTVETATEAVREGAYDYLCKPVTGDLLRRTVNGAAKMKALYDEKERLAAENRQYQNHLESLVESRTADLNAALIGTIVVAATIVEKRDPYTAGHQIRVAQLAKAIAEEMALPKETVEGIHLAGGIHDIGKIAVPAEILNKPGRLSTVEFALIKTHPQTGYDILQQIKYPWPLSEIVLQHHERQDGSGYPRGLTGDKILIEARILAVADVIEAMAAHRPYRPALGTAAALEEILQKREQWYDAAAVDACVRLFREKDFEFCPAA